MRHPNSHPASDPKPPYGEPHLHQPQLVHQLAPCTAPHAMSKATHRSRRPWLVVSSTQCSYWRVPPTCTRPSRPYCRRCLRSIPGLAGTNALSALSRPPARQVDAALARCIWPRATIRSHTRQLFARRSHRPVVTAAAGSCTGFGGCSSSDLVYEWPVPWTP